MTKGRDITGAEWDTIRRMSKEHKSANQIAEIMGLGVETVHAIGRGKRKRPRPSGGDKGVTPWRCPCGAKVVTKKATANDVCLACKARALRIERRLPL